MKWEFENDRPKYLQIKDKLKFEIISGKYKPREKFPTVRELSGIADVNVNTMQKALQNLEREGFLITNRTNGRVVTADVRKLEITKGVITKEKIKSFLANMQKMGYCKDQVIKIIIGHTKNV